MGIVQMPRDEALLAERIGREFLRVRGGVPNAMDREAVNEYGRSLAALIEVGLVEFRSKKNAQYSS